MRIISITILTIFFAASCATIPLSPTEEEEQEEAMDESPVAMCFYERLLQSNNDTPRTPISVESVPSFTSDLLMEERVKSRKDFSGWERFKIKWISGRKIPRSELDIRTDFY